MKIELQDILNATGLGFGYLLSSLVANLLNAALEPTNPHHALAAMNTCHKLAQFADRPHSPMPFQVIASLIQSLGPPPGATCRVPRSVCPRSTTSAPSFAFVFVSSGWPSARSRPSFGSG